MLVGNGLRTLPRDSFGAAMNDTEIVPYDFYKDATCFAIDIF